MSTQPAPTQLSLRSSEGSSQHGFDQIWNDALQRYKDTTKRDFPLSDDFPSDSRDPNKVTEYIVQQENTFSGFRASGKKIRRVLKPIVKVVLMFVDAGAEAAAACNMKPGGKAIFVAVAVLLQAAKGVSKLYDEIESVLQQVKACLARVELYLEPTTPPSPALMDVLVRTFVQVFIVLGVATKYCDHATDDDAEPKGKKGSKAILRRIKDYFRGILGDTEVEDALKELAELTNEEQLIVAAHTNAVIREVQPKIEVIYDRTVIDSFRSWLRPPNELPLNYESKRQAGSCQWFFDEKFEEWKTQKDGVYWVYGHAGAGKSVLCSSVIDALKEDPAISLSYFYFDYSDTTKQDCRALALSLVFQLATCSEKCQAYLQRKQFPRSPTYDELLVLLSGILGLSGRTIIVIDALDECPERARGRTGLMRFFETLQSLQSKDDVDLRVLLTSRPEIDIKSSVSPLATHSLNINVAREHTEDIRNYLSTKLFGSDSEPFSDWDVNTKWKVYNVLRERSNGMFLWVVLQIQDLRGCLTSDVDHALDELPSDLDGTYERILENFPSKPTMITRARYIFECVAFAQRLLSPTDVAEILSIDLNSVPPRMASTSNAHAENPETIVLRTCPRLIEIVSDNSDGKKTVQFIHRSVKEYLTSLTLRRATSSPAYPYRFDKFSANITLAKICLSVLIANGTHVGLVSYADNFWDQHVSSRNEYALSELLELFLRIDSPAFSLWAGIRLGPSDPQIDTAFYCAAKLGLCRHVKRMLECSGLDPSGPADGPSIVKTRNSSGRTALHEAVCVGLVEICRLLLEHGALIDDADNNGYTPLHLAAYSGKLDTVHLLLKHPAADGSNAATLRCRTRNKKGQTALHQAAHWGSAKVCRLLLQHGALVDDVDNNGHTPLHDSVYSGDLDTVRLLLQHPAADGLNAATLRCHTRDKLGQTALYQAVCWGRADVCQVLLEHGALVDDADMNGDTPFYVAAFAGYLDIIRLFLQHPAADGSDTAALRWCARDARGRTVLHRAAYRGHAEVCRILIEHGALVDEEDNDGKTPLQLAKEGYGPEDVVPVLLEHGAKDVSDLDLDLDLESESESEPGSEFEYESALSS